MGPVSPGSTVDPENLGHARVSFRDMGREDDWLALEAPADTGQPAVTVVVRGGTGSAAEEAERRVRKGKNALRAVVQNPRVLPGGGAPDVAAARDLRSFAPRFGGREQLAIESFADVLEGLPKTLARNAGRDPSGTIAELRTRHEAGHDTAGLDVDGDVVDDVLAGDAIDPFRVRTTGLVRAVEFVNDFTRIDSFLVDQREPSLERELDDPYLKDVDPEDVMPDPDEVDDPPDR